MYRVVVMDSRKMRNSEYIEKIGFYNPLTDPAEIKIDKEKTIEWLKKGAVPTDTVFNLLQKSGVALEYHLEKNKADDKTRQIELQKWELAKKELEDKKRKELEEQLKKQAEEEAAAEEPVVAPAEEVAEEETEAPAEEATEETSEEEKTEE